MFRHARLRAAIRPRWQRIASARGRGAIEVSWSKNDSIALTNPDTGTYSPQRLYDRRPVATDSATSPTAQEAARVAEFRVALRRFQHRTELVARDCGITPALVPAPPADQGRAGPDGADNGHRTRRPPPARPEQRHGARVAGPAGRPPPADSLLRRRKGRPPSAQRTGGEDLRPRLPESRFRAGGSSRRDRRPGGLTSKTWLTPGSHQAIDGPISMGVGGPGRVPRPRRCCVLSPRLTFLGLLGALVTAMLLTAGTAGAAIAPPWCGTPEPDAAGNLPDGAAVTDAPERKLPAHSLLRDRVHARPHRRGKRRSHDGRALRQVRSTAATSSTSSSTRSTRSRSAATTRTGRRSVATRSTILSAPRTSSPRSETT